MLLGGSAFETVAPAFIGSLVESLLDDMPESPEETRRSQAGEHHQQEFVSKGSLHRKSLQQVSCQRVSNQ